MYPLKPDDLDKKLTLGGVGFEASSTTQAGEGEAEALLRALTTLLPRYALRCLPGSERIVNFAEAPIYQWIAYSPLEQALSPRFGFSRFIHPEDLIRVSAALQQAIAERSAFQITYRIRTLQGHERWILEEGRPSYDLSGQLMETESLVADVTERKRMLDEVEQQRQFYAHTLDKFPLQLVVMNPDQRFLFVNPAAEPDKRIREWMVGKDEIQYASEKGIELSTAMVRKQRFVEAIAQGAETEWEEVSTDGQGDYNYVLRRFTPIFTPEGRLSLMLGYGFDVTDRRRTEERTKLSENLLQSVTTNVQAAVFRFSHVHGLTFANQAFVAMSGAESFEEIKGKAPLFFLQDSQERKRILTEIEKDGSVKERETSLEAEGKEVWILLTCQRSHDVYGNAYYDGVILDYTAKRLQDELLRQRNAELQKANSELDRFVYSASHDLRAPLTSILGILRLAELESPESHLNGYFRMIKESVGKLDTFVKDIISYYRNTHGEIAASEIHFSQLINESFAHLRFVSGATNIRLRTDIDVSMPFYTDQQRLTVIINNIISNALKYHNKSQPDPYVLVTVRASEDEAIISIEDNGPGIPENHQGQVFDMFYRVSDSESGTGLGLYIVKESVELLGGRITLHSRVGLGTTFTLYIPNQPVYEHVR